MKKFLWMSIFGMLTACMFVACSDDDDPLPATIEVERGVFAVTGLSGTVEVPLEVSDPAVRLDAARFATGDFEFQATGEGIPTLRFVEVKPGAEADERILVIEYTSPAAGSLSFGLTYDGIPVGGSVRLAIAEGTPSYDDVTAKFTVTSGWVLNIGGRLSLSSDEVDMSTVTVESVRLVQPQYAEYFTAEVDEGNTVVISVPKPEFAAVNPGAPINFVAYINVSYGADAKKGTIRSQLTVLATKSLVTEQLVEEDGAVMLRDAFERVGIEYSVEGGTTLKFASDYELLVSKDGGLPTSADEAGMDVVLWPMSSGPDSYWPYLNYDFTGIPPVGDLYDVIIRVKPTADADFCDYVVTLYRPVAQ